MRTGMMAGALLATMLAGCGGLRSKEAPELTYALHAVAGEGAPAVIGVLALQRPVMQPGLDTERIALTRGGNELDYFAASRWGETLPRVVSAFAVQSLGGGGGFSTVLDAGGAAITSDYQLLLTVRHFEAGYASGSALPVARVEFECVLTAGTPRKVLGRCDAGASEPLAENRMAVIVAGLERAAQRALEGVRAGVVALADSGK